MYKKVFSELWDEYCRLRTEVKEEVHMVVKKVNADFGGSRKEFWAL